MVYNSPKRDGSGRGVRANRGRNPSCSTTRSNGKKQEVKEMLDEILERGDVLVVIAIVVLIILVAGAWFVGYRSADGVPDVIDLTDVQSNGIVKEQQKICNSLVRDEARSLNNILDEKDVMIDKLYNYRNVILAVVHEQQEDIRELRTVVVDLNALVSDLNCS